MAGPTRPTPPSAIDGFRRLERTRTVATPSAAIAATATFDERPGARRVARRRTARRFAGAMRLLVLVVVLATIIGSIYILAGLVESERAPAQREPAAATTTTAKASEPDAVDTAAGDVTVMAEEPATTDEPVVAAADVVPTAAPATAAATGTTPAGPLPFTDAVDMQRLLLGGSLLMLLGMLLQVAGQPLPARARR